MRTNEEQRAVNDELIRENCLLDQASGTPMMQHMLSSLGGLVPAPLEQQFKAGIFKLAMYGVVLVIGVMLLAGISVPAYGQMPPIYSFRNQVSFSNGHVFNVTSVLNVTDGKLVAFRGGVTYIRPNGQKGTALMEFNCGARTMHAIVDNNGMRDPNNTKEFDLILDASDARSDELSRIAQQLCGQQVTELTGDAAYNACEATHEHPRSECSHYLLGDTAITHNYTEAEVKAAFELAKDCNWDIVQANSKKNEALSNNNSGMAQYYANLIDRLKAQQQKDGNCLGIAQN